jgi:asparagine synthase (glutamine-hydrolysing)
VCGVVGTINRAFDQEILNLIKHRGPDDSDIIEIDTLQNRVFLGHVRLSIQDLSYAGHQPMYSDNKKFIISFNGEIYNHLDLRKKLGEVLFRGHSDTETIVNYIAKFGIESIRDFNGIFGFSLLDIENQKLYLARDRYGVKPIYYYQNRDEFIYSSEIRPIERLIDTHIDRDHLATLLKLRYNPSPTTLHREIEKLRAGHILEYDLKNHNIYIKSYIEPPKLDRDISFQGALERYGELFEKAIKRQLLSDVEVGVLLSGGIDSALVAYYAQKFSHKPIKTFTIGFGDDKSDERADAKETAEILGTEHYEIKIDENEFEEIFKKCIDIVEEPLGTTSIIPMYYLNQLVKQHGIKVVLTGQGADEPLGGYGRYRGEILSNRVPSLIFKWAKPLSKLIKRENIYRAINSLGERDTVKRWQLIYSIFSNSEIKKLIKVDELNSSKLISYFYNRLDGKNRDSTDAMMSNDIRMNLCDDLLLYTDKISMNFSIEARVPMLDNDLVDFVESLPLKYKINGKEGKYIHKKFAETVLPKEIIYREKKGFNSPTQRWFEEVKGLKYKYMLTLNQSNTFSDFFDLDEVDGIFTTHIQREKNMEKQLFILISIYYWMQRYEK